MGYLLQHLYLPAIDCVTAYIENRGFYSCEGKAKWALLRILCKAPSKALWATFQVSGPRIILFATTAVRAAEPPSVVSGDITRDASRPVDESFLGRLSWESRGRRRGDSEHRDRACHSKYGCRCRDLSIPRRREHAVARRAKKKNIRKLIKFGDEGGWARETRLAHYSPAGARRGRQWSRIGDPWWNGEKSKNPNTCGTLAHPHISRRTRPCLTFLPATSTEEPYKCHVRISSRRMGSRDIFLRVVFAKSAWTSRFPQIHPSPYPRDFLHFA